MRIEAVVIVIGDELVQGHVRDTNSQWIAARLRERSIPVRAMHIAPDDPEIIAEFVRRESAVDGRIVITTGGVGPTPDDVTYGAVATAMDVPLRRCARIESWIDAWHPDADHGSRAFLLRMARIPAGSYLLAPERSGGPAVAFDVRGGTLAGGTTIVMLPGELRYVEHLVEVAVLPVFDGVELEQTPEHTEIVHRLPESRLARCFHLVESRYPEVDIGSYPGSPMLVRLIGKRADLRRAERDVSSLLEAEERRERSGPSRRFADAL